MLLWRLILTVDRSLSVSLLNYEVWKTHRVQVMTEGSIPCWMTVSQPSPRHTPHYHMLPLALLIHLAHRYIWQLCTSGSADISGNFVHLALLIHLAQRYIGQFCTSGIFVHLATQVYLANLYIWLFWYIWLCLYIRQHRQTRQHCMACRTPGRRRRERLSSYRSHVGGWSW